MPMKGHPPRIVKLAGGSPESTFSRAFAEFMNVLDLTEFIRRMENIGFGPDAAVFNTLNSVDAIAAPGGFTQECLERKIPLGHITRYSDRCFIEKCCL